MKLSKTMKSDFDQERRTKLIEGIIALIIICLIALAFYEYGRISTVENVTEDYENSHIERDYPIHYPFCMPTSAWDETISDLQVPN